MTDNLTRRALLERAGLSALGAAGIYSLLEGTASTPARAATRSFSLPPEQHLIPGLRVIVDNHVDVVVPPLHHQVVTAKLRVGRGKAALRDAQGTLEHTLQGLERRYAPTPGGLAFSVSWGVPYFRRYVPALADRLPTDLSASKAAGKPVPALLDAIRFPSDPKSAVLEQNDVCFIFQSDSREHIADGARMIFEPLKGMFELTSIRKGFVGGGFDGQRSLPKTMAMKAGVRGAELIPETAQLFLGFTSTQRSALGPGRIASFETLPGLTDQWPRGYFRHGTTVHLSHVLEDLELWYGFGFIHRVWAATDASRAAEQVPEGTQTLPEGLADVQSEEDIAQFAPDAASGLVGHSASMHPVNRLPADVRDNHGVLRRRGTPILQRVDFNTLDNPFFWSSRPRVDRKSSSPAAGLHFVAFSPTSDLFHRMRLAMDGRYSSGRVLPLGPRSFGMGMNAALRTTHRQNFLVPPRRHRSFPLAELL